MKKITKIMALLLALIMMFALVACGNTGDKNEDTSEEPKDVVEQSKEQDKATDSTVGEKTTEVEKSDAPTKATVCLTNTVPAFKPWNSWNPYVGIVYNGVYERLAERVEYGSSEMRGVLLESFEKVDDYTYKCKLYDYIKDANGNPFTVDDVAYSYAMNVENKISQAKYVEEVEKINDYEFNLKFNIASLGTFEYVMEACWMATEEAWSSLKEGEICVGTGPYICTNFVAGSTITVEKHGNYWQKPELTMPTSMSNVDVIEYNIVNEVTQMGIAMHKPDENQICCWLDGTLVGEAKADSNISVTSIPSIQWKNIRFNCSENSPCHDINLRKAILYAIDNQAIIDIVYDGIGYVAPSYGMPMAIGYNEAWETGDYYNYNMDKAKEYLAQSEYPNGGIELKFSGTINTIQENTAAYLNAALEPLGIKVVANLFESAASKTVQADFTAWDITDSTSSLQGPYMIQTMLQWLDANYNSYGNALGIDDPELQGYIDACNAPDASQEDLDALVAHINEQAYMYHYFIGYFDAAHSPYVENIKTNFKNNLIVGACTFAEDYPYTIENS